jgi:chromosome segregation ATPase
LEQQKKQLRENRSKEMEQTRKIQLADRIEKLKQQYQPVQVPDNCILIAKDQLELLKKQIHAQVEKLHLSEIEKEAIQKLNADIKKREQTMMDSHQKEISALHSKIEELRQQLHLFGDSGTTKEEIKKLRDQNRELELDFYKERLQSKKLKEQLNESASRYKQLELRFAATLTKNIKIVKELKEKQVYLKTENQRLQSMLSMLSKDSVASQFIHQLVRT